MALTFPLALDTLFAGLPVAECEFNLPATMAMSRTRGGAIKTARLAERLWTGKITLAPQLHRNALGLEAMISTLLEPGRTFLVHPLPFCYPRQDPSGAGLGGTTPVIYSIEAGGREFRISGLPAGYVLSAGDMLSFAYGSNPVRYAMHRVVTVATANGSGLTPNIEITPPIRPGATVGAAVTLARPFTKAILIPPPARRFVPVVASGLTIDFVQTLG